MPRPSPARQRERDALLARDRAEFAALTAQHTAVLTDLPRCLTAARPAIRRLQQREMDALLERQQERWHRYRYPRANRIDILLAEYGSEAALVRAARQAMAAGRTL